MTGWQFVVRLFWWLLGLGIAMAATGAGDLGDFFMVLAFVIMVPYGVVFGLLMSPAEQEEHRKST